MNSAAARRTTDEAKPLDVDTCGLAGAMPLFRQGTVLVAARAEGVFKMLENERLNIALLVLAFITSTLRKPLEVNDGGRYWTLGTEACKSIRSNSIAASCSRTTRKKRPGVQKARVRGNGKPL